MKKSSLISTMSYGSARIISALVGVLSVPVYTHILKLEEYGAYAIAFSTVSVFNALLFHWITAATARIYPRHLANIPRFIGLVIRFWGRSLLALLALSLVAWMVVPGDRRGIVLASAALLVTTSLYEFGLELSRSALRPGAYAIAVTAYALTGLAVGTLLAYAGQGAVSPLWGLSVGQLAAVVALRRLGVIEMTMDADDLERRTVIKHMLLYGLPLSGALVLSMLLASVDRYMIEHFLGLAKVAIYAASYALIFPGIVLVASVINLTGYPRIMRAFEAADFAGVKSLLREQITALLVVLLPILLGALMLTGQIAGALPQGKYSAGVLLLPYITFAAILNVLRSTYVDLALHITKKVIWLMSSLFIALLAGVTVNVMALPRLGILGAAFALCACYLSALAVSGMGAVRNHALPLPSVRHLAAMLAGLVLMWAVLWRAPVHVDMTGLAVLVMEGGLAYLVGLAVTWFIWARLIASGVSE